MDQKLAALGPEPDTMMQGDLLFRALCRVLMVLFWTLTLSGPVLSNTISVASEGVLCVDS